MDDYTPTTDEVRGSYSRMSRHANTEHAEFDRWLAAHDRAIRALAWDKGFRDGLRQGVGGDDGPRFVNPHEKED